MVVQVDDVVGFVVHRGGTYLLCMPKWNWILDGQRWNAGWERVGRSGSDFADRGGIVTLDRSSVDALVSLCRPFCAQPAELTHEILRRAERSTSWWDVNTCFPKLIVDFDCEILTVSFQSDGDPSWDLYAPAGWRTRDDDFVTHAETCGIDPAFRYWTMEGENLLRRFSP